MQYLDLTLHTPAENLALDEALLEEAEAADRPIETLRLWEPLQNMVVVGRSSKIDVEVNTRACRELGIPVLRRISGGAAVVCGPGCFMYSLVLSVEHRTPLRAVDTAHCFVLGTLAKGLSPLADGNVHCQGTSDLVVGQWKFSGNSVRLRRRHLLYHGTLLLDFPLELIAQCLAMPPRQPDYRKGREHGDFVKNLAADRSEVRTALIKAWEADRNRTDWPKQDVERLVRQRYALDAWNQRGR